MVEGNLQRETGDTADLPGRHIRAVGPALVLDAFNSSHPSDPSAMEARETQMVPAGLLEGALHSIAPAGTVLGVCRLGQKDYTSVLIALGLVKASCPELDQVTG